MGKLATFIKLATVLVLGGGTLGSVVAVSASQDTKPLEVEAVTMQNTKARLWVGYDKDNPFFDWYSSDDGDKREIVLWIHKNINDSSQGEKVYKLDLNGGSFWNSSEPNYGKHYGWRRYDFFDIDSICVIENWYMTIQKFQNGAWCYGLPTVRLDSFNINEIFYIWGDGSKVESGNVSKTSSEFCGKVLESYYTCSDSDVNGYNAFDTMNKTFFVDERGFTKYEGSLSEVVIDDYDYKDGNYNYDLDQKTINIDCQTKYNTLKAMHAAANGSATGYLDVTDNSMSITITFSVVGISAIIGFVILHKKRKIEL